MIGAPDYCPGGGDPNGTPCSTDGCRYEFHPRVVNATPALVLAGGDADDPDDDAEWCDRAERRDEARD